MSRRPRRRPLQVWAELNESVGEVKEVTVDAESGLQVTQAQRLDELDRPADEEWRQPIDPEREVEPAARDERPDVEPNLIVDLDTRHADEGEWTVKVEGSEAVCAGTLTVRRR